MPDLPFENSRLPQVRIVNIIPKVSEEKLFTFRKCYIGISLDNPVFYDKSLLAILSWAAAGFEQCLVVLGDYLRRYNEYIFKGLQDSDAQKASYQAGDIYISETKKIFNQFSEPKIILTRWQNCLQTEEFKKSSQILDDLYITDSSFRASVQKDALAFIKRQKRKKEKLAVTAEQAIETSSRYLLEEIAVFSALSEQGWNVELYPGPELAVLVDIAKGNFSDIPAGLKKRINVQLRIGRTER
jgi:tRNA-dependent cyclodipeptide synthase